jgi:peptidyl-tRNA hydrolase
LPHWRGPGTKHPGSYGFEARQTRHHYVIARRDLPVGVLAAQIIHAAGESSPGNLPEGTIAVALGASSEKHLERIERKLRRSSIPHRAIREPDAPWNGALMAIGICPVEERAELKPVTNGLPLIK